ncbi:MAG: cysteine protease [Cyanobacteria bacterium RYN_339]|nr:cysteine protease [Cyanobacteria bacterium RYN_339]
MLHRPLALLIAAVALVGCGRTLPAASPVRAQGVAIAGQERTFGFDFERAARVPHLGARAIPPANAPAKADNRQWCAPVGNQGKLQACTAFAMVRGLREYNQRRFGERATALSPLWLYYHQRLHMGAEYVARDSGSTLSEAAWVMLNLGAPTEAAWPYLAPQFAVAPSQDAEDGAKRWRLRRPQWLGGWDEAKLFLGNGQAVAFGFKAYESIKTVKADGIMPMPGQNERLLGGHAVLAVGYDDAKQQVICRNSWGETYGDHGYFYMPYAFIRDGAMTMDFWTADG